MCCYTELTLSQQSRLHQLQSTVGLGVCLIYLFIYFMLSVVVSGKRLFFKLGGSEGIKWRRGPPLQPGFYHLQLLQ